jgi:ABC-type lipoprotein export system ATPase subunit/bifunctional DNA-binding transcriptional regulator/antitoxin component of YhaV-PrlF toxin-antitoxin module
MVQEPFIICDNLVKIYKITDLEVVALQGLDLVVAPGELLGIVGVSGSGKSTLMNILGGLDRPSAGRVWVNGNDLLKMSATELDHYRRSNVGFVWQQSARNLIPYLTAQENVELPMTLAGEIGRRRRDQAMRLLEVVGLADRCSHHLAELSGGEQQRVAIAVSLANKPQLLLADEPTGELDEATSLTIYDTFIVLSDEFKLTTLIVSHDPGLAHHMDRVVAIRDGKTATETVRQNGEIPTLAENLSDAKGVREGEVFEEFTMLDSAGRLQVPQEYLEQFNIRGRVKLEVKEEGILIRPAPPSDNAQSAELLAEGLVRREKSKGLRGFLRGLRKGNDNPEGTEQ